MNIKVTPTEGLKIPDLRRKDFIEPEGRVVADSAYWRRRERDKDVTVEELGAASEAEVSGSVPKVGTQG